MNHNTNHEDATMNHNEEKFHGSNFPTVCGQSRNDNDWRNATLADLTDLFVKGEVAQTWATSKFWEKYPHTAGTPAEVTAVFIREGLLPPELLTRKIDGEKLEFSPRSLESGLQRGTLKPETCNDGVVRVLWKGVLVDYSPCVFWIRLTNAARKAADKAAKTENAGTSRKETKNEREWRERAEKAEEACKAKDAMAAEAAQRNAEFTERVRKLVHQLVETSQAAPGQEAAYEAAAMSLLNLLP